MTHPNILKNLIKEGKLFQNTLTGAKFVVTKVEDNKVFCRVRAKLKRGHCATPVEFTLDYDLFAKYLDWTPTHEPTFVVLDKI